MSAPNSSTALPSGTHGKKPNLQKLKKYKEQLLDMSVTTMNIQAVSPKWSAPLIGIAWNIEVYSQLSCISIKFETT